MTGLQKIIKLESDLTHMFDSDQRVAMAVLEHIRTNKKSMLEEEEQLIVETLKNPPLPPKDREISLGGAGRKKN
jgi:hypothetical protein